jgi:hypothetical protein
VSFVFDDPRECRSDLRPFRGCERVDSWGVRKAMGGVADRGTMGSSKTSCKSFYERFGDGDLDAAVAVFAMRVQINDPGLGVVEGLEALRNYLEG